MEIKDFTEEGHTIIEISGSLDSNTSTEAQDKITPLITEKGCMVLDLSKCKYVSSAGLRLLLMIAKELSSRGGWLTLAGLCEEVRDVMQITGFSGFFKAYNTVKEAVEALKKESK